MAENNYYYGKPSGSAADASSVWTNNIGGLAAGSVSNAYSDGGWMGGSTNWNPDGGGSTGPSAGLQASTIWNNDVSGLGGLAGGISDIIGGIGGLADMWFKYDALKAQKNSARDAHEANRTVYNNSLTRAKDVQYSISGKPTTDNRANIKGTTV